MMLWNVNGIKMQNSTNSLGQSLSWEANNDSVTQENPQRFITVFTRADHWSLTSARCIHSTTYHPISLRHILILCSFLRLGLPNGFFPSGDP